MRKRQKSRLVVSAVGKTANGTPFGTQTAVANRWLENRMLFVRDALPFTDSGRRDSGADSNDGAAHQDCVMVAIAGHKNHHAAREPSPDAPRGYPLFDPDRLLRERIEATGPEP